MKNMFLPTLRAQSRLEQIPHPRHRIRSRSPFGYWLSADGLISLVSTAGGFLLVHLCMNAGDAKNIVTAHLPGAGASLLTCWMRITLALLPDWILFGLAGACCLGGGICCGVLALRGLCDGAALGCLLLAGASPVAFCIRTALLLAVRLGLSLCCRATAVHISDPTLQNSPSARRAPHLSPLMCRHLVILLIAGAAGAAVCGVYVALMHI